MILKFEDIVFAQKYELQVKKHGELKVLDVPVSLLDEEARELGELIKANDTTQRAYEILFNDQWEEIQELLVGPNLTGFIAKVMGDFSNFTMKLIQEVATTEN